MNDFEYFIVIRFIPNYIKNIIMFNVFEWLMTLIQILI
jgi:hypothetical protein